MNHSIRWARLALAATIAVLVSGCSSVGNILQDQYDMAQNIAAGCKAVDEKFILPTKQTVRDELIGRLRTRLTSAYCSSRAGAQQAGDCTQPANDSLKVRFTRAVEDLVDHLRQLDLQADTHLASIRNALLAIDAKFNTIDAAIDAARNGFDKVTKESCQQKELCARALIADLGAAIAPLRNSYYDIEKELAKIAEALKALRSLVQEKHPALLEELELAITTGRQVVEGAYEAVNAFIHQDASAVVQQFMVVNIEYKAATHVLKLIERGLQPADRLLDKADERFFLLPTVTVTLFTPDIQKAIDRFYGRLIQEPKAAVNGEAAKPAGPLYYADMRWAFAKASCVKLTEENGSAQSSSQLMPFVSRMFVFNVFPPLDKEGKPVEPPAQKNGDKIVVDEKKIGDKVQEAFDAAAAGDTAPLRSTRFHQCYVSQMTALAAQRAGMRRSADAGAQACGQLVAAATQPARLAAVAEVESSHIGKRLVQVSAQLKAKPGDVKALVEEKELKDGAEKLAEVKTNLAQATPPYAQTRGAGPTTWSRARYLIRQ